MGTYENAHSGTLKRGLETGECLIINTGSGEEMKKILQMIWKLHAV